MSQDSKGSFYEGTKIADVASAQQLAQTEASQGVNAALAQEKLLKTEFDTGLTELQRNNIQIIEGLKSEEKYPYAFGEMIAANGDKVSYINFPEISMKEIPNYVNSYKEFYSDKEEGENTFPQYIFCFTKNGVYSGGTEGSSGIQMNISQLLVDNVSTTLKFNNNNEFYLNDISHLSDSKLTNLKKSLEFANNYNKKIAEEAPKTNNSAVNTFLDKF
jgi:hypothetical protein